jgi:hypothetical protein
MKADVTRALQEVRHLFVDDGSLAAFAIVLIAFVGGGIKLLGLPPLWGGGLLVVGLAGILVESLQRASKAGKKR